MFKPDWLRLPSGIALALGLSAFAPAGTQPETRTAVQNSTGGELLIRLERGRLQISENGGPFEELALKDTPEARHLKNLLEQSDAANGSSLVRIGPTILAGGGGSGFSWNPLAKTHAKAPDKAVAPAKGSTPEKSGTPRKPDATAADKKG
jgi:hypothetical protein